LGISLFSDQSPASVVSRLVLVIPNRRQPERNLECPDFSASAPLGAEITILVWIREGRAMYNFALMIPKDLLEIVVCPACRKPLELRTNPETLKCSQCHRVYPVRDDIAVLLEDEATIEPS
jgi:LSD1 subclass zinc finger protein